MKLGRTYIFVFGLILTINSKGQKGIESHYKAQEALLNEVAFGKKSSATDHMNVLYHRIELNINPYRENMSGSVFTTFQFTSSPNQLVRFDLANAMEVDSVVYHSQKVAFIHTNERLEIQLPQPVALLQTDSIQVYYKGNPTKDLSRAYAIDYHFGTPDAIPVQWTLSEPYGARAWWPCSQQLKDKVDSLDLFVEVPVGMRSASNGILQNQKGTDSNTVIEHWKHRYPITTYLIAVAVTNYEEFDQTIYLNSGDSVWVQNLMYPEYMHIAREEAKELPGMMRLFSDLFGDYPFKDEKYGHAQFGRGGGMEHQTMSFMVDLNFALTAHELAHQWFGNSVTCGTWEELWLNESFATYLAFLAYEHLKPREEWVEVIERGRSEVMGRVDGSVFAIDTLDRSHLFSGRLRYRKGALVLHMLRWKIGDEAFYEGINHYLNQFRDGFGTTAGLKLAFEKASGEDLTTFFDDWYTGEGYPIYELNWSKKNHIVELTLKQTPSISSASLFEMPVPIRFSNANADTTIIVDMKSPVHQDRLVLDFIPTRVDFDPDLWILGKSSVLEVSSFQDNELVIYPNPASNTLTVLPVKKQVSNARIIDVLGRVVLDQNINPNNTVGVSLNIDLNSLTTGFYILELFTSDGQKMVAKFQKAVKAEQ